ncbi:MAG: tRNA glutamyl-Q(34) synthetase GluQRS [Gammaproteobacteria bacterium]|uniref:tRNA glutamyl-Q(34) synthetase GluQRS n=1 Tax=Marinomonas sp. ef1 TaxID=2005043 RepID=UPI000C28D7DE|nr:tRNA glutamyl-Q(34) synthetase GluQRS [Marinomonas sp. ef1]MBU2237121.1 tRNA glutamyl-Q(34) synthetase GluQRS [Gammaproteobacteria bacterium]MBU2319336.1 tRNA glutamyl-Q(34) synthetase GluQRS [Gammaproteobacteria bacterium]
MSNHDSAVSNIYRGRFAPSPTGPLHFGSLVSALASYLDAKKQQGSWIIRIEDVDGTRCKPSFSEQITETLNSYQLFSDEPIRIQSQYIHIYEQLLSELKKQQIIFPCNCTRQSLAQYNGNHPLECQSSTSKPHSWRLRTSTAVYQCQDSIQGTLLFTDDLKNNCPILKRKDGFFSYQLAVVVDDHLQKISHLVRGADLIETTAQQLYLYDLFGWTPPKICHIPLITNHSGDKISKQNHAKAIENNHLPTLLRALHYLKIDLVSPSSITEALSLAIEAWDSSKLKGIKDLPLEEQDLHFI